ncbi:MAG: DUF3795 domain-containing protein [Thermodesulfobacteriota bacterium]
MEINPAHISPCGLYCGVCGVYQATQDRNQKFLKVLLKMYKASLSGADHLTTEDLLCDGCRSERRSFFCRTCSIRDCSNEKKISGCHECNRFPCEHIKNFLVPTGKKVILRSIPYRRRNGTRKWIEDEEARYLCPGCNNKLFRGAKHCGECRKPVSLD